MKWHTIAVRVTEDHFNSISKLASANEQSVGAWCKLALLDRIKGTKPIPTTLLPGQDLIVQNRNNSGKFVKRSK